MLYQQKPNFDMEENIFSKMPLKEALQKLQDFFTVQQLYSGAIREISTKLEILDDEFHMAHDHNPIHHVESRLKSPVSIIEKLKKSGLPVSTQAAVENILDIAGIRVICCYINDIYIIAELLVSQDDVRLIRTKDYIQNPKENGYRSLHLIVEIPVFLARGVQKVPVEIQIRTMAMDFWASLEHQLKYKSKKPVPQSVKDELNDCAAESAALDLKMQSIFSELEDLK